MFFCLTEKHCFKKRLTSLTTMLIVGNMKAIVMTWLGFLLFGHVRHHV